MGCEYDAHRCGFGFQEKSAVSQNPVLGFIENACFPNNHAAVLMPTSKLNALRGFGKIKKRCDFPITFGISHRFTYLIIKVRYWENGVFTGNPLTGYREIGIIPHIPKTHALRSVLCLHLIHYQYGYERYYAEDCQHVNHFADGAGVFFF